MTVLRPTTLAAALDALGADPATTVLAGGTDLMVAVHEGRTRLERVLVTGGIPELRRWHLDPVVARLRIGAGVTAAELTEPGIATAAPALAAAARSLGSFAIRHQATLGGSLGTSSPAADLVTALGALDAVVELRSTRATRRVPVGDFVLGSHENAREPDELIVAVEVDGADGSQAFTKVGARAAVTVALVNAAVVLRRASRRVRVVAGAVGPTVVTSRDAEDLLAESVDWGRVGWATGVDPEVTSRAFGARLAAACHPVDDARASAAYRRHAVAVVAARLARECLG